VQKKCFLVTLTNYQILSAGYASTISKILSLLKTKGEIPLHQLIFDGRTDSHT
jgi:hypothetical protein